MKRILGCDISEYQGTVDFQKMEDAGAKYVIMRKQKGYYSDLRFFENLEKAKQTNLKIGAYGVPFPGYDITRQYAKFIEGISPSDLDFPPFADVERRHSYTKSFAVGRVLDYAFKLKDWWGDAVFYTAKYVWQDYYSAKSGWIDDWDLWVANYRDAAEPYYIPHGWEETLDGTKIEVTDSYGIWQCSADGNGRGAQFGASSRDIDIDLMKQWFWDKHIPGTPVPPPVDKVKVAISYNPDETELVINEV